MVPRGLGLASLPVAASGFAAGFALIYVFDLAIHRRAPPPDRRPAQRESVARHYRRRRPLGDRATVLATGTSIQETIEGLSIGVGVAIEPAFALLIAGAIAMDNLGQGLSIGLFVRDRDPDQSRHARRILGWTGLIGGALVASAVVGWVLLRALAPPLLGGLIAFGAGAPSMLRLSYCVLRPRNDARSHHHVT